MKTLCLLSLLLMLLCPTPVQGAEPHFSRPAMSEETAGLSVLSIYQDERKQTRTMLTDAPKITALGEDAEGDLWAASSAKGINRLPDHITAYAFYQPTADLDFGIVQSTAFRHLLLARHDADNGHCHLAICNPRSVPGKQLPPGIRLIHVSHDGVHQTFKWIHP